MTTHKTLLLLLLDGTAAIQALRRRPHPRAGRRMGWVTDTDDQSAAIAAALRMRNRLSLVSGRAESIGILRAWGGSSAEHAAHTFEDDARSQGWAAETARLRALVDRAANARTDPDWP